MLGSGVDENPIWSAIAEPLSSFVVGPLKSSTADDSNRKMEAINAARQADAYRKRYRKRVQTLQNEVEEVNEEATKQRRMLWETQDKLKEKDDQIRKLEHHLSEILDLREKDLYSIKSLRAANSDCVENESRARDAMEVFKKCYKRAQLKIKEHEEEIGVLREYRATTGQRRGYDTSGMVNESALEYIQSVSNEKEKKLKTMLSETEVEVDLWKSKYKVANKRCQNWQEQILAMEHPSEGAEHIKKQRVQIETLEEKIHEMKEKETREMEERDSRLNFELPFDVPFDNMINGASCNEEVRDGLARSFMEGFENLKASVPNLTLSVPNLKESVSNLKESVPECGTRYSI